MATQQTRTGYYRLYQNSKRLFWDPAAIDLTSDPDSWAAIRRDHGAERYDEQILRLCSLFYQGEESVTRTLSPFLSAVARLGLGLDKEMFLASQLYEEAKHFEFFSRYFAEVLQVDGAETARHMESAPQAVLVDDLEDVSARLRREDDPARLEQLLVEGVTHYMGVVEALLARTGYMGANDALAARGWLPGLQEGFRLIRRDEGRHVAFGIRCIGELVRRNPGHAAIVHATFERHLPNVLATVAGFDYEHSLVDLARLTQFAVDAYGQFLSAAGLANDGGAGADALAQEIGEA